MPAAPRAFLLCALAALAASCRDSTSPESLVPAALDIVDGDHQEATVGTELPSPLAVRLRNAKGRAVPGQLVVFRVVEGGGSVYAGAAITDESGIARERWTLGTSTTGNQKVEARAVDTQTGDPLLFGVFQATAKPGPAVSLERITAALADQVVGSTAAPTPAVRAIDQYENPVPGVTVSFVASAGGAVTGGNVITGSAGVATVGGWTLATTPGANTLTATAIGLPVVTFTSNGVVGAATQLTRRSTDPQSAPVATSVVAPPSVAVLDQYGNPVGGIAVTFVITGGGGTVTGANQTSNELGIATLGAWTLGTASAQNTLEARAAGKVVVFSATSTAGPPSSLSKLAGDIQTAEVGHAVAIAPKVRVADQYGNLVPGVEVTFTVTSGGGTVTPRTVVTGADGLASVGNWTLGTVAGANTLSVNAGAAPTVTFAATAEQGQGVLLRVSSEPPNLAFPGVGLGVAVRIEDGYGNSVPQAGLTVTAAIASGPQNASLAGSTATTDDTGAADFGALAILGPDGTYSVRFTASGMTGVTSRVITLMRFATVSPGSWHSCALDTSGIPYCWGNNESAQLGDGTIAPDGPTQMPRLRPQAVGGNHRFTVLHSGDNHTCGLAAGGSAYCWGNNESGQLGDGTTVRPLTPIAVGGGLQFVDIVGGSSHTCGRTAGGAAYCWGRNVYGQLGDGTVTSRALPTSVAGNLIFASISAGSFHTCGLLADGEAYCWGSGSWGNLGAPTTEVCFDGGSNIDCNRTPRAVTGGLRFASIAAGWLSTCALDVGGVAYCWGRNETGELGDGTRVGRAAPTLVATAERFLRVATGGNRSCAVNANGTAFCWGAGGQVGDGTTTMRLVPALVAGGHSFQVIELPKSFLGSNCGITSVGTPVCWGDNAYGGGGDGTTSPQRSPTPVKPPE